MKIQLVDFKEGVATEVHHVYDPKHLDIEFVDLKYNAPLNLSGTVEKGHDLLTFRGELVSHIERTCGRCLKTIPDPIKRNFEFFYETKGKEEIETTDDIREVLILDHPLAFVCREDCRGLCPECGVNRNETPCNCKIQVNSKIFFPLKEVWTKRRKEKSRGQS